MNFIHVEKTSFSKPIPSTKSKPTLIIDFPITQFYMVYKSGGLELVCEVFHSEDELQELYDNTLNFYRWVWVESINEKDWNLDKVMPLKTLMVTETVNRKLLE